MDITIVRPIIKWKFNQLYNVVNNSTIDTGMTTCISIYSDKTNNHLSTKPKEWVIIAECQMSNLSAIMCFIDLWLALCDVHVIGHHLEKK